QRRHFGEVVAFLNTRLERARQSRQIVPFYESLPFAERCAACKVRPAETINDGPVCGVCVRKRKEASGGVLDHAALIRVEALGLEHFLESQRSPSAYRRVCAELNDALRAGVKARPNINLLATGNGWMLLAAASGSALEAASAVTDSIALQYGIK